MYENQYGQSTAGPNKEIYMEKQLGKENFEKLKELAKNLDKRLANLASVLGNTTDYTLLVMAALMMEDEIATVKNNMEALKGNNPEALKKSQNAHDDSNQYFAETMKSATIRIEKLAKLLENS